MTALTQFMNTCPLYPLLLLLFFFVATCEKEEVTPSLPPTPAPVPPPPTTEPTVDTIRYDLVEGFVQKGPYLNGTEVEIAELKEDLSATGRTFSSQTVDNRGAFGIRNVELVSQYVELKANGFYYNEVTDDNSAAQLTLYALSDLTGRSSLNVNLLSTLERGRVEYLVIQGMDFAEAKQQAQKEILALFEFEEGEINNPEHLDISRGGKNNAKLLAASLILQGYLEVADLSELLANLNTDLREDGTINSAALGSQLVNNARLLRPAEIRRNLESRYAALGSEAQIPAFEPYLRTFIDSTDFEYTDVIVYPKTGMYGPNLLLPDVTDYRRGEYSLAVQLPEANEVKVKISGANWYVDVFAPDDGFAKGGIDWADSSRIFTSTRTGDIDFKIYLMNHEPQDADTLLTRISLYENGAAEPKWTKKFYVPR